ncbi:hypothetical protein TNCT_608921, partial [Trichonephila clavata]
ALVLYTDGSRSDSGRTGSGAFMGKKLLRNFDIVLETLTTAQFSVLSLLLLEKLKPCFGQLRI